MDSTLALAILIIAVALALDYINGFHDSANSIAMIVATRVLSPGQVILGAVFQFHCRFWRRYGRGEDG
jgi:inorganic phosphate transporter, PiT family